MLKQLHSIFYYKGGMSNGSNRYGHFANLQDPRFSSFLFLLALQVQVRCLYHAGTEKL